MVREFMLCKKFEHLRGTERKKAQLFNIAGSASANWVLTLWMDEPPPYRSLPPRTKDESYGNEQLVAVGWSRPEKPARGKRKDTFWKTFSVKDFLSAKSLFASAEVLRAGWNPPPEIERYLKEEKGYFPRIRGQMEGSWIFPEWFDFPITSECIPPEVWTGEPDSALLPFVNPFSAGMPTTFDALLLLQHGWCWWVADGMTLLPNCRRPTEWTEPMYFCRQGSRTDWVLEVRYSGRGIRKAEVRTQLTLGGEEAASRMLCPIAPVMRCTHRLTDELIRQWQEEEEKNLGVRDEHGLRLYPRHCTCCSQSPDGQLLAFGMDTGAVILRSTRSWEQVGAFGEAEDDQAPFSLHWSPDGRTLLSLSYGGTLSLRSVPEGSLRWQKQIGGFGEDGEGADCYPVVWSPGGELIAVNLADREMQLRRAESGEVVKTLIQKGSRYRPAVPSWSPDGSTLIWKTKEWVRIWKVRDGLD